MQLLPRDEKFFDLLLDQAKLAFEASTLLAGGFKNGSASKIRDLERKGDQGLRQINRRLHKTFITPIDPEDIQQLASLIDEILDHLEAVSYRIDAYGINNPPERMSDAARRVNGCVEATLQAITTLQQDGVQKPDGLTQRCEEINRRELETEDFIREAVRDLFAHERDPIALMKHKEIYEFFESTADCCENVADVLEAIAVKNS